MMYFIFLHFHFSLKTFKIHHLHKTEIEKWYWNVTIQKYICHKSVPCEMKLCEEHLLKNTINLCDIWTLNLCDIWIVYFCMMECYRVREKKRKKVSLPCSGIFLKKLIFQTWLYPMIHWLLSPFSYSHIFYCLLVVKHVHILTKLLPWKQNIFKCLDDFV